jgi:hypothetical protein
MQGPKAFGKLTPAFFRECIEQLKGQYDYLVFGAVLKPGANEALLLRETGCQFILAAEQNTGDIMMINRAIEPFSACPDKWLGVVYKEK